MWAPVFPHFFSFQKRDKNKSKNLLKRQKSDYHNKRVRPILNVYLRHAEFHSVQLQVEEPKIIWSTLLPTKFY